MLERHGFAPTDRPICFICGPTPFVETVASHLVAMGYGASSIKTERFGPTGEGE
jgi:ferredoxin-NADP reductase